MLLSSFFVTPLFEMYSNIIFPFVHYLMKITRKEAEVFVTYLSHKLFFSILNFGLRVLHSQHYFTAVDICITVADVFSPFLFLVSIFKFFLFGTLQISVCLCKCHPFCKTPGNALMKSRRKRHASHWRGMRIFPK